VYNEIKIFSKLLNLIRTYNYRYIAETNEDRAPY